MITTIRSAGFVAVQLTATLVIGIVCLPSLVSERAVRRVAKLWLRVMAWDCWWIAGLRWRLSGQETIPEGPVLYAMKHQSAWETLILAVLLKQPAFVLKKELLSLPLFGMYLAKSGMIAIDRQAGASALKQMVTEAQRAIAAGRSVVIFPEGTRTRPGESRRYHPGVFALYRGLGVPVIPVALNSGLFWSKFTKRPGIVDVAFLPAVEDGQDRRAFLSGLENTIETETRRLEAQARQA